MHQKLKIFGISIISLFLVFGFLNNIQFSYSKPDNDNNDSDSNYEKTVKNYDKEKNCTTDLSKEPNNTEYLTYFNCGHIHIDSKNKKTTREFTLMIKENQTIPISNQGHKFIAWTFNGTIPGPTMRMTEGDDIKITVVNSILNKHPHSLHMHSIHNSTVDGIEGQGGDINPGQNYTYSFTAQPFGVYPYHCHVNPIADHINRGLYGMFIIDPKEPREKMQEFAMLMNGYDLNYEQEGPISIPPVDKNDPTKVIKDEDKSRENEIYTVNGKAFEYMDHPIKLEQGKKYRIYLVNMLEFDLINSFHLHGMMFNYINAGTSLTPEYKTDVVTLAQGDRGILEFTPEFPGRFMFHAHQGEFTDLGWMGMFNVL